jgi:hypothetical protein
MLSDQPFYKKYGFLLLVNTAIIVLMVCLLPVRFETNDDAMMLLIGSGVYSGTPDAHLVFINYIYGLLVSFLYTYLPGIEWYTILFLSIHVIATSIITWRIANTQTPIVRKLIYILLFYAIEIWFIRYIQFTTTAAICALSGIILFLQDKKYQKILAIILFLLASLIRFESAFLILIICSPLGINYIIEQYKSRSYISIALISLFFILPVITKAIDSEVYNNNDEWKKYKEYNDYRGKINDNPNAEYFTDLPSNLYKSDYTLFLSFFPDTGVFDNATVKHLYSEIKGVSFFEKITNIPQNIRGYWTYIAIFLIFGIIQIILLKDRPSRIVLLTTLILFALLLIYISLEAILKYRVFLSIIVAFSWVLFATGEKIKDIKLIYKYTPILLILIFFLIRYPIRMERHDKAREETILQQKHLLDNLKPSDGHIIAYGASMYPEFVSPFRISNFYKNNRFLGLGWMANIPFNNGILDSYKDLIDKNAIYLNHQNLDMVFILLKNSISIHYNIDIDYKIIGKEKDYMVVRLITRQTD